MEDFDFKWIFYLLAALYFIFRSKKKKPEPDTEYKPFESDNQPTSTSKPVTFEDLLREIQQSKLPAPQPQVKPVQSKPFYEQPKYVDYDDDLENEAKDLEEVDYKTQDEIYETYEKAKREAFNRASLEETSSPPDMEVERFSHFKEYESLQVPSEAQKIAKDLQNPENVRRAFVLSEILNRKY